MTKQAYSAGDVRTPFIFAHNLDRVVGLQAGLPETAAGGVGIAMILEAA